MPSKQMASKSAGSEATRKRSKESDISFASGRIQSELEMESPTACDALAAIQWAEVYRDRNSKRWPIENGFRR